MLFFINLIFNKQDLILGFNQLKEPKVSMLRLQTRLIKFSIINPRVAHSSEQYKKDHVLDFYPIVGMKQTKLGALSLNQPNNQNSLTLQMIDEMFRFLNSYHSDQSIENIWMQNRGNMFSSGLNLYELKNNPEYLDRLYRMIAMFAKQNKPIITYCSGGVRNIGAYILSMSAFVLNDPMNQTKTTMRIDETSKGFIPVAGGTHRLSRIPANMGMYLAMTGKKINANQMSRLGFIQGASRQGVTSKTMRHQISRSNLFFRTKVKLDFEDQRPQQADQWDGLLKKRKKFQLQTQTNQSAIIDSQQSIFTKFAMNQYRLAQVHYQNTINPYNSFSEKIGRTINNYYMLRHQKAIKYLVDNGHIQLSNFENYRMPSYPIDKIDKIFGQKTLKDALALLEADQSQWAEDTLHQIKKMDPLAASLTFQLIRRAQNLSWDQCMKMQYTVGRRLLSESQLKLQETLQGSKYVFKNEYSGDFSQIKNISQKRISDFFRAVQDQDQQLVLDDVPQYAFYPTSDYKQIPDSARMMINNQFFNDRHLNNQYQQSKRYLESQKIDYRHKSYEIDSLREKLYNKYETQKVHARQILRIQAILNNHSALQSYISNKTNFIENFDDKEMKVKLQQRLKQAFNAGLQKRFEEFKKTANIIGKQNKMKIFKNIRNMLIKSVVLNGNQIQDKNIERNLTFKGPVYFDESGKNYFESSNPIIQANNALSKLLNEQIGLNMQISQNYHSQQGSQTLDDNLAVQPGFQTHNQKEKRQAYEKLLKRYTDDRPFESDKAFSLQQLVKKSNQTSNQLADYADWTNEEYFTTIVNQPQEKKTYSELGQKMIQRMKQNRQIEKQQLKQVEKMMEQVVESVLNKTYLPHTHEHKSQSYILENILPTNINEFFPQNLKSQYQTLLSNVLMHFMSKYYKQNKLTPNNELGDFDNWIKRNLDQKFITHYKYDIQFVFSYLALLKFKDTLLKLETMKNQSANNKTSLVDMLATLHIPFTANESVQNINKTLSKFLYAILDLHTTSKVKIRLPQSKLMDYFNRTKITRETNSRSQYPLSFESIMLMIAKDRSKIYNKVVRQYLPTEPQFLSQMAHKDLNDFKPRNGGIGDTQSVEGGLYVQQNDQSGITNNQKSLVTGYIYYLAKFDSILQKASGKYNFVSDQILKLNPKSTKEQLRQILNMQQTNEEWFDRISKVSFEAMLQSRLNVEKYLTKGELLAFDQQLRDMLNPELFKVILHHKIKSEIADTKAFFRNVRHYNGQLEKDMSETNEQMYCDFRRNVKNPDALRKLNNLDMATKIRDIYYKENLNQVVSEEQAQDLQTEKRQFSQYQRFPPETKSRLTRESFDYGPERQFEKDLTIRGQMQLDNKELSNINEKIIFTEDLNKINTKTKLTEFDQELKSLKSTLLKKKDRKIDEFYSKLEELL